MLTILGAMLLAAEAPPQTAPPPVVAVEPARTADPAALAEARDLLRAIGFEEQFEGTTRRIAEDTFETMMREFARQFGEPVPSDLRGRLHTVMMDNVSTLISELRPTALEDAARVYARYFTAAEIRELRQLQTNPVMIKMQRVAPQFMSELMQIGVAASARRMPEVDARVRREIEAWERDRRNRRPRVG